MNREELIKNSTVVNPVNLAKDRNNCLGGWNEELESACQEIERLHKQDGKGTAPPYFMSEED